MHFDALGIRIKDAPLGSESRDISATLLDIMPICFSHTLNMHMSCINLVDKSLALMSLYKMSLQLCLYKMSLALMLPACYIVGHSLGTRARPMRWHHQSVVVPSHGGSTV